MSPALAAIDHPAEQALFSEALTCDATLPAGFVPGERHLLQPQSEALLHGLAIAEDLRGDDTGEDRGGGELPPSIQRVEAKLDLMLGLLGKLARERIGALPPRTLRWSHRGIRMELADASAAAAAGVGTPGVLVLQPAEWLNDQIELPVTVLGQAATGPGSHTLWLRFGALTPGLEDALERHLFRLHRRQIAEARQAALKSG